MIALMADGVFKVRPAEVIFIVRIVQVEVSCRADYLEPIAIESVTTVAIKFTSSTPPVDPATSRLAFSR